jgi:ribosomal protein S18 acetylase RimI-like enzyme
MNSFSIRRATVEDALAVAAVKYHGWQNTYRGIISDAYLDAMDLDELGATWIKILSPENKRNSTDVMVNDTGAVTGFVSYSKHGNEKLNVEGEIMALYLLKEYHGKGLGAQLFLQGINQLKVWEVNSFSLFVLAQNPALNFYRKFKPVQEFMEKIKLGGEEYEEVGLV